MQQRAPMRDALYLRSFGLLEAAHDRRPHEMHRFVAAMVVVSEDERAACARTGRAPRWIEPALAHATGVRQRVVVMRPGPTAIGELEGKAVMIALLFSHN